MVLIFFFKLFSKSMKIHDMKLNILIFICNMKILKCWNYDCVGYLLGLFPIKWCWGRWNWLILFSLLVKYSVRSWGAKAPLTSASVLCCVPRHSQFFVSSSPSHFIFRKTDWLPVNRICCLATWVLKLMWKSGSI